MSRVLRLVLALTWLPGTAAAQQPCTSDARHVVNELYRHMLERPADSGSVHWVQQLESGRMTVREVVRAIAMSPEHARRFIYTEAGESAPYERSVARLYRHLLGRQPDADGQRAFAELAQRSGARAVVEGILNSREYVEQFGDWGVPGSGGVAFCATSAARQGAARVETAADRRFRGMDRNNDGVITRTEWRGSRRSFEVHDWNGDGVLSGAEVDAGAGRAGRTAADEDFDRGEQFEFLDVNGNGRIEPREWHGSVAAFHQLDVNNDNWLSRAEFTGSGLGRVAPTTGARIIVDARERWVDTGLVVERGDLVLFEAGGTVRLSDDQNDVAGPAGAFSGRRASLDGSPREPPGSALPDVRVSGCACGIRPRNLGPP